MLSKQYEVTRLLGHLADSLKHGARQLQASGIHPDDYQAHITRGLDACTVLYLDREWVSHVLPNLTDGVPFVLLAFGHTLPNDRAEVGDAGKMEILAALKALHDAAILSDDPRLILFLDAEVERIRRAVVDSAIIGVDAFTVAAREARESWIENAEVLAKTPDREAVNKLGETWATVAKVGQAVKEWLPTVVALAKGVTYVLKIAFDAGEVPQGLSPYVQMLLERPPERKRIASGSATSAQDGAEQDSAAE